MVKNIEGNGYTDNRISTPITNYQPEQLIKSHKVRENLKERDGMLPTF